MENPSRDVRMENCLKIELFKENTNIWNKISRAEDVQEVVWSIALRTSKPGNWMSNDNAENLLAMQYCPLKLKMLLYETTYSQLF